MRIRFVLFTAVAMTALLLVGCGQEDDPSVETNTVVSDDVTNTVEEPTGTGEVTEIPFDEENVKEYDATADNAVFEVAVETLDLTACNTIENTSAREGCVNNVVIQMAKTSTDAAVCDQTMSEEAKNNCLSVLGSKVPKTEDDAPVE